MRKCGFHVQATSPQLREAILAVKPTVIVSLAHDFDFWRDVKRDLPGVFLIGRRYEEEIPWWNRLPGGWAEQCAALEMPYDAFITDNEPKNVYNELTMETAAQHDDWCCRFRERILQLGYEAVALNVPTGHFHRNAVANLFPNVCQAFRYIGLHEYSARAMWDQDPKKQRPPEEVPKNEGDIIGHWYCQRYRDWHDGIVARWPEREGQFQLVVTECGVAYGVMEAGHGDVGWQTDLSVDQYMASLRWYFGEMNEDDYCLGGAIFMMGFADHKWASFETLPLWERLLEIPEAGEPEPPPDNGGNGMTDIRVIDIDRNVLTGEAAQAVIAFHGYSFGHPVLTDGDHYYKLVELEEKEGPAAFIFTVLDLNGNPVEGAMTAWRWTGFPQDADDIQDDNYGTDWYDMADLGPTKADGKTGPAMTTDWYTGAHEAGPGQAWIRHPQMFATLVKGIGMIAGTNHRTLNGTWQETIWGEEPPPEPPPGPPPPPDTNDIGDLIAGVKGKVGQDVQSARYGADGWGFEFYPPKGE